METESLTQKPVRITAKVGLWLLLVSTFVIAVGALLRLASTVGYAFNGITTATVPGVGGANPPGPSVLGPKVQQVLQGGSVDLVLRDLHWEALVLNTAASVLGQLTVILVSLVVLMLCWRLLRGVPFAPKLTRSVSVTGTALFLIGLIFPVLQGFSKFLIVNSLDNVMTIESPIGKGSLDYYIANSVDLLPLVLGIALLLLAAVFAKGAHLQRDTEGLV